jgi:hypothetical protein
VGWHGKGGFLASNRNIRILTILHANFNLIAVFGALRHTERYGPLRWVYSVRGCVENLRWSNP